MSLAGVDALHTASICSILWMRPQVSLSQSSKRKLKHLSHTQTHCITDALGCMRRELNGTAKIECEDFNQYIDDSVDSLGLLIAKRSKKDLGLTNSNECACEGYEEKPFVEFVKALESLLQRVYSSWSWNAKNGQRHAVIWHGRPSVLKQKDCLWLYLSI